MDRHACPCDHSFPCHDDVPFSGSLSAQWPSAVDSDADIATGDEIRAPGVDVWIPAHELFDGKGILVPGDDVPAGISLLDYVEQIA